MAGVIGTKKFTYDVWGDSVNVTSRMESSCLSGKIQVTKEVYDRLRSDFDLSERGIVTIKGKGEMTTYFLNGVKEGANMSDDVVNPKGLFTPKGRDSNTGTGSV